ncbi:hypothetical protein [Haladaptatus salinisoli]|uniref:hypothetical protein n=1 Tax=Haladaptatus salinisoli TaxID=2884876 RepID=UPI001D0B1CB0|nr:hypothetical protein [Haladaptatus salinisoli]
MSTKTTQLRVNPPIGGYVIAAMFVLLTILAPISAVNIILSGDLVVGLVMLFIGTPMFAGAAYVCRHFIDDIREYRQWLRVEHQWLYALGVVFRLAFVALVVIGTVVDILYFASPPVQTVILAVGVLAAYSALSVLVSAVGQMLLPGA